VYFSLYVFRQKMERQNILNEMTEHVSKFDLLSFSNIQLRLNKPYGIYNPHIL